MNLKLISAKVSAILNKFPENSIPVNIEDIAQFVGLKVMPYPLDEDVFGFLVIDDNGNGTIGYNVASLIPILRQISETDTPLSDCLSANTICASVNFDFFMGNFHDLIYE